MQHELSASILVVLVITSSIDAQPLTVFVHNYAEVGQPTLEQAETEAARILGTAGIEVNWVHCSDSREAPPQCGKSPDSTELVLHLLPAGATRRNAQSLALGFAVPPGSGAFGSYAGVLYDGSKDSAPGPPASLSYLGM